MRRRQYRKGNWQARDWQVWRAAGAQSSSSRVRRSISRRSRLVGRPAPGSRLADGSSSGFPRAAGGSRSSHNTRASSAEPRRSAKPKTLSTRTVRSNATVTTSLGRTARLGASIRWPLTRTWPEAASTAAAERVRTTRACHSHLSMRWRSKLQVPRRGRSTRLLGVRFELLLERGKLGEGRVRIGRPVAPALALALDVFGAQLGVALGTIAARRTVAPRRAIPARRPVGALRMLGALAPPLAAAVRPTGAIREGTVAHVRAR